MKTSPKNDLARALRRARLAAGLSQEGFGDVSGRTYISQLERGERQATLSKVDDLASVLCIHPASLVALAYLPQRANRETVEVFLETLREDLLDVLSSS
jgi:transcriptional regulator with XRE-family HTH domain